MIAVIAGARPNFIKVAPLIDELGRRDVAYCFIHTGQHYDFTMSSIFLSHLELPDPDYNLEVGSGTHGLQTGKALIELERLFLDLKPNLAIVVGDINSTVAGALAAAKLGIQVAHVEAGLRSFDRTMPEEINRVLTDAISDYLFTTCRDADENLRREGISNNRIFFAGNVMIDSLINAIPKSSESTILTELALKSEEYIYITLHRPSNVDNVETLRSILKALRQVGSRKIKMVLPVHPRTRKMIEHFQLQDLIHSINGLEMVDPVGYLDSLALINNSLLVLTDSGGMQEESTYLGIPCLTLRPNTERPITVTEGTNILLDRGPGMIVPEVDLLLSGTRKTGAIPELWDGKASERIVDVIINQAS